MSKDLDPRIQEKIIGVLTVLFPDAYIYLYGSRATKTNNPRSDIDLAIDAHKELSFCEIGEARDILSALNIPYKCDVIDYQSISDEFKKSVDKDKIIWKS